MSIIFIIKSYTKSTDEKCKNDRPNNTKHQLNSILNFINNTAVQKFDLRKHTNTKSQSKHNYTEYNKNVNLTYSLNISYCNE